MAVIAAACTGDPVGPEPRDEDAGSWRPWVLASGSALRPPAPASATSESARLERDEIVALQAGLTTAQRVAVQRWDGPPSLAWGQELVDRLSFYWALLPDVQIATPVRAGRATALLHTAIADAMIVAWDAKYAYRRAAPSDLDDRIQALAPTSDRPGFPSEHAAAAAAAQAILSYLLPLDDPARFETMAREAADSRIWAGAAHRSDVEAGWALGQAVATRVLERARQDGSDAVWTGSRPVGPQYWVPTPPRNLETPYDPLAASWRPWVLASTGGLRPAPHPALGSGAFTSDLEELRRLPDTRTQTQADRARFWATDPPSNRWMDFLATEVRGARMSPPAVARAFAVTSVAMADAFLACWDGKFHYWLIRPISVDPAISTVFSTPPFPSYPSGHSTVSAAAAEAMAYLFPLRETYYRDQAHEASESRVWGGVHYRFDITAGEELGAAVGRQVVDFARQDGANPRGGN